MFCADYAVIYIAFTATFFGITAILSGREIDKRTDFKMVTLGGTYNVYLYYKHIRKNNEQLSIRFKLFLIAHLNFILCIIAFLSCAFYLAGK
tara:strand:- start:240 stop:515 length:276 start_codon:yes stop_codon:yes gene_type:complete